MFALLRVEFVKQVRRVRTLVTFLVLTGLPLLIVAATKAREHHQDHGDGERHGVRLFVLARQSGLLMPAVTLEVMSFLFLLIVAALFAGDSIAGEAASGNLRYVLLRPVSRVKLVLSKLTVALVLTWVATFVVSVSALAFGVAFFGWHPITLPPSIGLTGAIAGGTVLTTGTLLSHLLAATAYVAFGVTAAVAVGVFFSAVTDSPAGAIGATVGVYIVSAILDGVDPLGVLRYGLPTHYSDVWSSMFTANAVSNDITAGIVVQFVWLAVFGTAAVLWFRRKDITS